MLKLKPDDPRSLGSYTITDVIGEGGMGRVYLGHLNGKLVAVKVMSGMLAADPTLRSRFRREIDGQVGARRVHRRGTGSRF
jgi:serine/threonine protein kinase